MGGGSGGSPGPVGGGTVSLLTLPSIPPHALGAFTLFLRLPGYAETLLKDTHKACCLLRLALGVTDDGDGGKSSLLCTACYVSFSLHFCLFLFLLVSHFTSLSTADMPLSTTQIEELRSIFS